MAPKPELTAIKTLLAALVVLPALPFLSGPAGAQEQEQETAELDRQLVTGSRIRTANITGQSPVLTLTRDDLERTGKNSIGDILQQLTASGSALNTKFNSSGNFGFPPSGAGVGAGATTVDLRHLGSQRVLVLVDGLRWVNESSASGVSSIVDLNTIPMSIVERIEILEDGASAIYGTDAIAGVVNIITRKDFEGAEATAYYGQFDEGDGETFRGEASFGGKAGDLSFFLSASYADESRISSAEREISRFPVPGTGLTRGSSGTPFGRFIFADPVSGEVFDLTLKNAVPGAPVFDPLDPTGPNSDFKNFTNDDRFNFSPFNLLLTPSERTAVFGQLRYDLNEYVSLYFRGMFNERQSVNQAAPEPIFLGPEAGTGSLADTVSIDATNPFNPFGFTLDATDNFLLLGRRPLENGPRIFEQDIDTRYLAAGFQGQFNVADRAFFWDLNFVDAQSEADQITHGSFNIKRIAEALGPVDDCAAIPGCVPLNLFGGAGSITPEMLEFITFVGQDQSEQELQDISFNITGDLFDLPAGTVGIAAGYEHREQDGFFLPDSVIVAGESNGVPALPTSGSLNFEEVYGELNIPLLSDLPGIQQFDAVGAVRYTDFNTSGSSTTFKAGFRWQVTEDLLFRGSFAEGIRSPGIGELFGTASRFDDVLDDRCSDFLNTGVSQQIINNCIALGVPADGSFEQVNQQISVVTGGNIELTPETTDSYSAGLVYSASWAEDLSWVARLDFAATFYRHELEDAIQAIDAQTQLDACINDPTSGFCDGISRAFTGAINDFQNRLTNIGGINTQGVDFKVNYTSPQTAAGQFGIDWTTTWVDRFNELLLNPDDPDQPVVRRLLGVEENDRGIAEFQSNLILVWQWHNWSASWTVRFIDNMTESCSDFRDNTALSLTNFGLCSNPDFDDNANSTNKLDSRYYNDFQVSYDFDLGDYGLLLTGGVNNLLDKDPPICLSCSLNGFDASNHDLPGQFWYFRGTLSF